MKRIILKKPNETYHTKKNKKQKYGRARYKNLSEDPK